MDPRTTKQGQMQSLPVPMSNLQDWETYLRSQMQLDSGCRLRRPKIRQTPEEQEGSLLRRLTHTARRHKEATAISEYANSLQKQALELIKLRREVMPLEDAAWQRIEGFLAAAHLYGAIAQLMDEVEALIPLHAKIADLMEQLSEHLSILASGASIRLHSLVTIKQEILNLSRDAALPRKNWYSLCTLFAELELGKLPAIRRLPLASAFQTAFLCADMNRQPIWQCDLDSVMIASLVKDVAFWHPKLSKAVTRKGHHTEWSAGMISAIDGLRPAVVRLVRQHHECLDRSGIPFGVGPEKLHTDDRVLGLATRWTELMQHEFKMRNTYSAFLTWDEDLNSTMQTIEEEVQDQRWDQEIYFRLKQIFGYEAPEPKRVSPTIPTATSTWRVPRPKFLKARFPILGRAALAKVHEAHEESDEEHQH